MANIASLSVQLTAKIGSFSKRLGRARKLLKRFAKGVSQIISRIAKVTAGLAVAATAAITALAIQSAQTIDNLAKTADKLGIAIGKLRAFQFAAKLAGVETKVFQKGLQKMVSAISEASTGIGESLEAFNQLGVDLNKLKALSPDRQFLILADAINKVALSGDKVRLIEDIFGARGVGLLNLLSKGSVEIGRMEAEINKLRGSINRIDAAKVEEANDTFAKVLEVIKGIGDAVAIQFAPLITALGNKFIDVATEGDRMGHVVEESFQAMVRGVGFFGDAIQRGVIVPFKLAQRVILELSELGLKALSRIAEKALEFIEFAKKIPGVGKAFKAVSEFGGRLLVGALDAAAADARKQIDAISEFIEDIKAKPFSESFDKFVKTSFEDAARNARKVVDGLKPVADAIKKAGNEAANADKKIAGMARSLASTGQFTQGPARLAVSGGGGIQTAARARFAGPLPRGNIQAQGVQTQLVPLTQQMLLVLGQISVNTQNPVAVAG